MAAAPQVNYANYPLKEIPQPHPHDVLCGRGGGTNNHIGNSHWRMLVAANKQLYITLPKRQKMLLSRSIVNAVRSQNPPGRFLQKDSKTNKWFDVGDQRAQEKTSQALREGAPDIRKKVAAKDDVKSTEVSTSTKNPGDESTNAKPEKDEAPPKKDDVPKATTTPKKEVPPPPPQGPPTANSNVPNGAPAPQVQEQNQVPGGPGLMHPYMSNMGGGYPANGGMQFPGVMAAQRLQQQGQSMVYYPGPNMAPMQVYPTMVLNDQGMMVPAMSVVPQPGMQQQPGMPQQMQQQAMIPPSQHSVPQVSAAGSAATQPSSNRNMHQQHHQQQQHDRIGQNSDYDPLPHKVNNVTPTFDEFIAAPPDNLDPSGVSFGSFLMSDADMKKLQGAGTSIGSAMSHRPIHPDAMVPPQQGGEHIPQALDGLEPTGLSFGDVSMMSAGTKKLEEQGCSFGTMMSYNTTRTDMPDGGLEAIGTSFGSLSLDATNRDTLFHSLEMAAGGPVIPPMFETERPATGNLLECSDTESETEESQQHLVAQKSAAWEKMQSKVAGKTNLEAQNSRGTVGSNELMPPPVGGPTSTDMKGSVLSVPTANFDREFSQLSAWSAGGDHGDYQDGGGAPPPPPQQLTKQDDDNEKLELFYLQKYETPQR